MRVAADIVNENIAAVTGTLRASGHVDGRFVLPDGRSGSYHLNGTLFYLEPIYIRFDLKSFGDRQFLFGSNAEYYWYYDREADAYQCGRHGSYEGLPSQIPIPPDQIVDALGLTAIPTGVGLTRPVQRVVPEYQQILFLEHDEQGNMTLQKEYWLDRRRPRLVRRVVFRGPEGVVEMDSRIDDYRPLMPGGPVLPRTVTATWPDTGAEMRFRISRWMLVEEIGPDAVQFAAPPACDGR